MALTGINSLFANPQSAGLLGLAQGLLSASGPSRLPINLGAAMGNGLGGMQQAQRGALQMQGSELQNQMQRLNLARTQSMYDLFMQAMHGGLGQGGGQGQGAAPGSAPMDASQAALAQGASAAPNATVPGLGTFNMGGVGPTTANAGLLGAATGGQYGAGPMVSAATGQGGVGGGSLDSNPFMVGRPANISPQAWMIDQFLNPQLTTQVAAANLTPSEQMKNFGAAYGVGTPGYLDALKGFAKKQDYIPPVRLYAGGGYVDSTGHVVTMPAAAPPGYQNLQQPDGSWTLVPVPGGPNAVQTSAHAKAAGEFSGKAENTLTTVYQKDASGNYVPVKVPVSQAVGAANGASNAQAAGTVVTPQQQIERDQEALQLLQQERATQLQRLKGATNPQQVALIQSNLQALNGEIQRRSGSAAQAPAAAPAAGPMLAEPPVGVTPSTNTAQTAPSKLMQAQQQALAEQDSVYQQSRTALLQMLHLAKNNGDLTTPSRFLPEDVATRISTPAAEYQKQHANFVALQGKALGSGGTDASRETIDESVPMWDKTQAAKIEGLDAQLNQLDLAHLKRQVLNGPYQSANQKAYTDLSTQFDNTFQPAMMPQVVQVLQMPPGAARSGMLAHIKQTDPSLAKALNLLAAEGVLK